MIYTIMFSSYRCWSKSFGFSKGSVSQQRNSHWLWMLVDLCQHENIVEQGQMQYSCWFENASFEVWNILFFVLLNGCHLKAKVPDWIVKYNLVDKVCHFFYLLFIFSVFRISMKLFHYSGDVEVEVWKKNMLAIQIFSIYCWIIKGGKRIYSIISNTLFNN